MSKKHTSLEKLWRYKYEIAFSVLLGLTAAQCASWILNKEHKRMYYYNSPRYKHLDRILDKLPHPKKPFDPNDETLVRMDDNNYALLDKFGENTDKNEAMPKPKFFLPKNYVEKKLSDKNIPFVTIPRHTVWQKKWSDYHRR